MKENTLFIKEFEDDSILKNNYVILLAYESSKKEGNSLINFVGALHPSWAQGIAEIFCSFNVQEFTISTASSDLIETLAEFSKFGFKVAGIVKVFMFNELAPAILLRTA